MLTVNLMVLEKSFKAITQLHHGQKNKNTSRYRFYGKVKGTGLYPVPFTLLKHKELVYDLSYVYSEN